MKQKILILLLCLVSILFFTGCSFSKKALSADEFIKIAEEKGLNTFDVKDQFAEKNQIVTATVAMSKNDWQIEHYTLSTKESAIDMFEKNKNTFEENNSNIRHTYNSHGNNYIKYTLETDTLYMVASRIDNTFVYAKIPVEYKAEAIEFLKAIQY